MSFDWHRLETIRVLLQSGTFPESSLLIQTLTDYRRSFDEQIRGDLARTVRQLSDWATELMPIRHRRFFPQGNPKTAQDLDAFQSQPDSITQALCKDLEANHRLLVQTDSWSGNRQERECWLAVQQFFTDALALADRLYRWENNLPIHTRTSSELMKRGFAESATSYDRFQAVANLIDHVLPGGWNLKLLYGMAPWLWYNGWMRVTSWSILQWTRFLERAGFMVESGALGEYREGDGPVVHVRGDEWLSDSYFFESPRGRTRHNLILAMSHRHSILDFGPLHEALHDLDHAVWGNETYFPPSAERNPNIVFVRSGAGHSMEPTLAQSAGILMDARMPLLLAADGGGPYLMYGQQMRVKRGIRMLVDYVHQRSQGTGRKTYIVPITLDDVVFYVRGFDPSITVTLHRPICSDDIPLPLDPPDPQQINWGDPLLNHLECLYLCHTGQVRHGWQSPDVIETVRRAHEQRPRRLKLSSLKSHPSLYDLSRRIPS